MTEEEKNNLVEKEIIKRIDYILDKANYLDFEGKKEYISFKREYLQDLFDLCKKKQKEIEELNSEFAINTEIHKRDIRIKELEEVNNCLHETNNDYISKDKIKHTLLKFQNEYGEDLVFIDRPFIGKEVVQYGEDMLDEIAKELDIKLLEEE